MTRPHHGVSTKPRLAITVAALGVVFGDIGTSPLYALRACFEVANVPIERASVLGVLSLIFWALALVITLKYISIVLRADNEGEGGVLALTTLVLKDETLSRRGTALVGLIGLSGCALFYGDGVITPAVTVLGALEGLAIAAPALQQTIVPATLLVLLWLFKLQRRGTGAIGSLFGPFMLIWFATLGILGARYIAAHPNVLAAVSPVYAVAFFAAHPGLAFTVMGAVFLAVTGGEALYTDLGHFGRALLLARGLRSCGHAVAQLLWARRLTVGAAVRDSESVLSARAKLGRGTAIALGDGCQRDRFTGSIVGRVCDHATVSAARLHSAPSYASLVVASLRAGLRAGRQLDHLRGCYWTGDWGFVLLRRLPMPTASVFRSPCSSIRC